MKGTTTSMGVPAEFIPPMTATVVSKLPEGEQWLYELKLDGYRAVIIKNDDRVKIISRNEKDHTAAYPTIVAVARRLTARTAVIDGEIVAVDENGRPSFQALQHRAAHRGHAIVFYAFDLLHADGEDLRRLPLEQRRARLPKVLGKSGVLLSAELPGTAEQVIDAVQRLGLEGIIAKRRDSRYDAGQRSGAWVKLKLDKQQEFVIGGYRPSSHGVDALVVGYYEGKELRFAAKVRAGFTPHVRRDVHAQITHLRSPKCPFSDLPQTTASHWGGGITAEQMKEFVWLKPAMVAQVRFVEWTADGHLRHSAFLGLREDKEARDVRRES